MLHFAFIPVDAFYWNVFSRFLPAQVGLQWQAGRWMSCRMYSWLRSSRCWPTRWVLQRKRTVTSCQGNRNTTLHHLCVCEPVNSLIQTGKKEETQCMFKANQHPIWPHQANTYAYTPGMHFLQSRSSKWIIHICLTVEGEKKKERVQVSRKEKKNIREEANAGKKKRSRAKNKIHSELEKTVWPV